MATTNDIGSQVDALLGTPACSPVVGRKNNCSLCGGAGLVDTGRGYGDDIRTETCPNCEGTGLARTLQQLIEERRALLNEMRAEKDIQAREILRAQVACLDVEIAEMRRAA